jgi:hypothetical protein
MDFHTKIPGVFSTQNFAAAASSSSSQQQPAASVASPQMQLLRSSSSSQWQLLCRFVHDCVHASCC